MDGKWMIIYGSYEGLERLAVNRIAGAISGQVGYAVPIYDSASDEALAGGRTVFIGGMECERMAKFIAEGILSSPGAPQGYSIRVKDGNAYICGFDAIGTLYGAVDFINHYMGTEMYHHGKAVVTMNEYYTIPLSSPSKRAVPEYERVSAPAVAERGIWTWGHCIYDYRAFLENMLTLKLNQLVIWNDFVPLNARQIVEYAHSLGIAVYWGFSWGWDTDFKSLGGGALADESLIDRWGDRVCAEYRDNYADTGADGIYFQSFTEMHVDNLDGVPIAATVVKWVNRISERLFRDRPDIKLQFGLHATSVRGHLDEIAKTDPRIRIVWEDCGAFPYDYSPEATENFDETLAFNKVICTLRGEGEKFGAVLKGITKLDWTKFVHMTGSSVIGESDGRFIAARTALKEKVWRNLQSYWLENAEFAQRMISDIARYAGSGTVQMLVEDGCFESGIYFPVALCSELLWSAEGGIMKIIGETARIPSVRFANN